MFHGWSTHANSKLVCNKKNEFFVGCIDHFDYSLFSVNLYALNSSFMINLGFVDGYHGAIRSSLPTTVAKMCRKAKKKLKIRVVVY